METSDISRYCNFLRSKLPEWKDLSDTEIDFHLFNSITNKVYSATPTRDDITPKCVILRRFCGEEGIVDLAKELKVFAGMSKCGAGPKCFGQEDDLRIEEYIPARIILAEEYKQRLMRRKLARATAAMHKIVIEGVDKETLFGHALNTRSFFELFDKKCQQDIYSVKEKEIINQVKTASDQAERDFIDKILPKDDIVLSHNDLLEGNVLITEENQDVRFIDYEYASYNFRGYDMGNMFREAMIDYLNPEDPYFTMVEENYPNEDELREFIRYYIAYTDMSKAEQKEKGDELIENDESMKKYLEEKYQSEELKRREDVLYREAKIGAMLSFYYWMIWAVKMFNTNDAQFNYLEFAKVNHDYYLALKKEILAEEKI